MRNKQRKQIIDLNALQILILTELKETIVFKYFWKFLETPWKQDVNWTHRSRSEDAEDVRFMYLQFTFYIQGERRSSKR